MVASQRQSAFWKSILAMAIHPRGDRARKTEQAVGLGSVLQPMPFDRRTPIWAQVHEAMRERIADLRLPPRLPLSEKEIAAALGISRTPAREALIRLSEEGLVDIYPQYGTFVAPIRLRDLTNAQFIRSSLECSVIAEVAVAATPALVAEIETLIDRQEAAHAAQDLPGFFQLDERMHQAFSIGCDREAVWRFIQGAKVHADRVRHLILPNDLRLRILVEEHRAILAAIRKRSPDQAVAAMKDHLSGLIRRMPDILDSHADYFERDDGALRPTRAERAARS
jgi:DNA-binding GntR family transcriptional regulator